MKHLRYAIYLLRHKWFVFIECCKLGIPLRGLFHDLSKFLPSEWFPYADHFYGNNKPDKPNLRFGFAWLLHQKRNRHHWQWWLLREDSGTMKVLEMSNVDRKEMLADWRGAGRALGKPDTYAWYKRTKQGMTLGAETRIWIESRLNDEESKNG